MCGRYSLAADAQTLQSRFRLKVRAPEIKPRFNIAPGQEASLILSVKGERKVGLMRWGLSPKWADPKASYKMINARSETVREKRAYSGPFLRARCLVPADGFYEWKKAGSAKQPFRFYLKDSGPFAFAGLYDNNTFTILTTAANPTVLPVHDRMPVILSPQAEEAWLNPKSGPDALESLLRPFPAESMSAYAVSSKVNSPANDDKSLIVPANEASEPGEMPARKKSPQSQMEFF